MNKIYKTVISRDEFINLYRFGMININRNFLLENSSNIEYNLIELFKKLSFNEASDYLILTIEDESYNQSFNMNTYCLNLQNMKRVEVLSEKSERFYRTKVNSKTNYHLTEYGNILPEIERYQELNDMNRGVEILFEQFDISNKIKIEENFQQNLLKNLEKNHYFNDKYQNFDFDLLSYRRENKFIKEDVSFIYDLMIIAMLKNRSSTICSKFKQGLLQLDNSDTYKLLNTKKQEKLIDYISFIVKSNDENIKKFLEIITKEDLIIGSIFLKIKSLLSNKEENQDYWNDVKCVVDDFKEKYPKELSMALYFIGLIVGYKELYNDYYDFLKEKVKFEEKKIDDAETKAKVELEKLQAEKDSKIKELEDANNIAEKEKIRFAEEIEIKLKELQFEKDDAETKAKEELKKLQSEKNSKIEEFEESKITYEKEKTESKEKAKDELEKLQAEKDSKIKELEDANNIAEKEKVRLAEEIEIKLKELQVEKEDAETKAKEELEKLRLEKDSKIKELEEANNIAEKEKVRLEEEVERKAKEKLEKLQSEKNSKIEEFENIEVDNLVCKKLTADEILKNIEDIEILQNIVEKLALTSKAKTIKGLKKAITTYSNTQEKLQKLSETVEKIVVLKQGEL